MLRLFIFQKMSVLWSILPKNTQILTEIRDFCKNERKIQNYTCNCVRIVLYSFIRIRI